MRVTIDEDRLHRPTIRWIERLASMGGVNRIAAVVARDFAGRESDGIYEVLGAMRYVPDAKLAGVLRRRFWWVRRDAEVVQSPRFFLNTRVGDCDDQAVLGAALAKALDLPYQYVLHKDLDKHTFHHVYLEVKDARGWRPVDRVWNHGPGQRKPGVLVRFRPLYGGQDMPVRLRVIPAPLPTTLREPVELEGLGDAAAVKASFWRDNPVGQALTGGIATLISGFSTGYAARISGQPVAPVALEERPPVAPARAAAVGVGALALPAIGLIAFLLLRRR